MREAANHGGKAGFIITSFLFLLVGISIEFESIRLVDIAALGFMLGVMFIFKAIADWSQPK